jgi:hypothetical protein
VHEVKEDIKKSDNPLGLQYSTHSRTSINYLADEI